MKKVLKITLVGSSILILLVTVFAFRYALFGNYDKLDNAGSASWLPEHTTEIYSRNSGNFEVYEFTISEREFLLWAENKELIVSPINEKPAKIRRYTSIGRAPEEGEVEGRKCLDKYSNAKLSESLAAEARVCLDRASGLHVAHNGFFGEFRASNYGGYTVVYDSKLGRAFYQWNTH